MIESGAPEYNEIISQLEGTEKSRFRRSTESDTREIVSLTLSFKGYQFE